MAQLKKYLIILEDSFHSELEVAFVQLSKTHRKIIYEFQSKMYNTKMVRGRKFCHVQKSGNQDKIFSHHNIRTL
jgi:hypothetical protein